MMTTILKTIGIAALAAGLAAAPTMPAYAVTPKVESTAESFDMDRADILAMAGNYKVRFDMQESTVWMEGYEALEPKVSGGHEVVRVIEDTGDKIILQHLLVVDAGGKPFIVKHWRQDWEYEPDQMLVYSDSGEWVLEDVPEAEAAGKWSQTVYQVDDSPRYAGIGRWDDDQAGVRRWRSSWTWRPLARRDAVRDPVYDRYYSLNRHSPMPGGWIHWQDNTKLMTDAGGEQVPVVQEYVLNTYEKFEDFDVAAADAYWADTQGYWAAVRGFWDEVAARDGGIAIEEEAETGTVISGELLQMGTQIHLGEMESDAAIARARQLIVEGDAS